MKPGNSGGGKAPDFWSADEEGKDQVHLLERPAGGGSPTSRMAEVKLGERNDHEVEIIGGVTEGTEVMIQPPAVAGNDVGG